MIDTKKIGTVFAKKRKEMHLTQEDAAEIVGVSVRTVRNIENGTSTPDLDTLFSLCDLYGIRRNVQRMVYTRSPEMAYAMMIHHIAVFPDGTPVILKKNDAVVCLDSEESG